MRNTTDTYIVQQPMRHRGQPFAVGAEIVLTADEAKYHRRLGNIVRKGATQPNQEQA